MVWRWMSHLHLVSPSVQILVGRWDGNSDELFVNVFTKDARDVY